MEKFKQIVAMIMSLIIVVTLGGGEVITNASEIEGKLYGPINIEGTRLSTKDIPDALEEAGELKKEIADKYVKRLYNEEKDMNTLLFESENGERTMYLFKKPVKYKDENGNIVDKDIRFKEISESYHSELADKYVCDNGNNDVKVYMPKELTDGIRITADEKVIEMSLKEDSTVENVIVEEDKVVYNEVFGEKTELIYTPLIDGIKEEIVLDKYTGQTEFTFLLKLDGYKLAELDDNCLYLENVNNGEIEGIIDSVYMIDNAGVTDFHNYYTYTELKKGEYEITAHVNEEFLTDENTQYPVIIDPTISINKSGNSTGIYDATLNSTSTTEGGSGSLYVGNRSNTENGISRVAMRFPGLDFDANKVSVVLSASISIRDLMCESSSMRVNCYAINNGYPWWTEANVCWDMLNMDNNPYSDVLSYNDISYSNGLNQEVQHTYKFDITKAVFEWRAGATISEGRGIVFVSAVEKNTIIHKTFGSYNRASYNPVFEMSYLPYNEYAFSESTFRAITREAQNIYGSNGVIYFNCLAMAVAQPYWIGYDELGINSTSEKRYLNTVGDKIVSYINNGGCSRVSSATKMGIGLSANYSIESSGQYFIALKIMQTTANECAFHVLAQTNTGTWMGKFGSNAIQTYGYINPDINNQACWKDPNTGKYYDSQTLYIRITQ